MVICKVKFLYLSIGESSRLHARATFLVCPSTIWILGHLVSRKCISCTLLMAWSIIKQKKTSRESVSPLFKNINGFINLSKEVVGIKLTVAILSSLEYNASFSVDTHLRKMI